jgi:hypothetical protein
MELDELCGDLDNALHYLLAVPPHITTLHLEDGVSPNHLRAFTSSSVTSLPGTPPALTIALKSAVEGKIIFLNKSIVRVAPAIFCLQNSFMLSLLDHLDESKLTHLLWMADVQITWVHFKEQVRKTKLLAVDDKNCLNFAIICDPIDCNQVL